MKHSVFLSFFSLPPQLCDYFSFSFAPSMPDFLRLSFSYYSFLYLCILIISIHNSLRLSFLISWLEIMHSDNLKFTLISPLSISYENKTLNYVLKVAVNFATSMLMFYIISFISFLFLMITFEITFSSKLSAAIHSIRNRN